MKLKTLLLGLSFLALPFTASAAPQAAGTNVIKNGTVYMITADGKLRPYTSAGAFLSYGFNSWGTVSQPNAEDLALPVGEFIPPRDGGITCSDRGDDKGTCYLITNSQKAAFTSSDVFSKLGFNFKNATTGDVSFLPSTSNINTETDAHLPGTLVNDNGTIKLIGSTGAVGVPSVDTLKSWGYSLNDVVPANSADKTITQTDVLRPHTKGELAPKFVPCISESCTRPPAPENTPAPMPCATTNTANMTCLPPSPTPSPSPVNITNLSPTSGPVGTVVTVTGSGFTATNNYVLFGLGALPGVSSTDGKTLRFTVPTSQQAYCSTSIACPMVMQQVTPGAYNVRVGNANGMSDSMVFNVAAFDCSSVVSCGTSQDPISTSPATSSNVLVGTVTSNATISLKKADAAVTTLAPGTYTISVADQTSMHNFHLSGPGVDKKTTVDEIVNTTWTVTLVAGTYTYVCDPHPSMRGSFTVTN